MSESLFESCKACGKQVSRSAKECQHCGERHRKLTVARCALIVFGALFLISMFVSESKENANESSPTKRVRASISYKISGEQASFSKEVARYVELFSDAKNELREVALRGERALSLSEILVSRDVSGWRGEITELATTSNGNAILTVTIDPHVRIKTWNNALSDLLDDTLIAQNHPVYGSLLDRQQGDTIVFSGSFLPSGEDFIKEASLTIRGSMKSPEYLFHFNDVHLLTQGE